jgi:hypothetical protein
METQREAVAAETPCEVQAKICEIEIGFDFEHWKEHGRYLRMHGDSLIEKKSDLQWAIGDWLLAAEVQRQLKKKKQRKLAVKIAGRPWGTLKNLMSISRRIPESRRRDDLSWTHHCLVAPFDEKLQVDLLDLAQEGVTAALDKNTGAQIKTGKLSVQELRQEIAKRRLKGILPQPEGPTKKLPLRPTLTVKCTSRADYLFLEALAEVRKISTPGI